MSKGNSTAVAHLAALFTILIWGTTFISTKVLLIDFTPIEILFYRFVLGFVVLFAAHPKIIKFKAVKEELFFAGAGLCGVTLYFLCENIALTYTQASNVGIIVSVAPFFTAVLAHLFLQGERLKPRFFAGFFIAIAGVVLIAFNGSYILKLSPKGDILAVLACVFWAAYSILMRKIGAWGYNNIAVTRRVFFYGLLFMLPALPFLGFRLGLERFANPINLLNLVFLAVGASALCFVIWNWCVGRLGAVKTSNYIYLIPLVTIVASYFILKERITVAALIGMVLTLLGLFLSEGKQLRGKKKLVQVK